MDEDEKLEVRVERLEDSVKSLFAAFPQGDTVGHCRAHQSLIEDVEARKRLRQAIAEKTLFGLIWAGLVGLAAAIWHELLRLVGRG